MAVSAEFEKAAEDSKKILAKPSSDELLQLYGLFKVAHGEDISKAEAPSMFDLKGKAKKNAWQKLVDEGVDAPTAEKRYIAFVEELKTKYGYDANKAPEAVGN